MNNYPGRLIAVIHRKAQIFWTQALKEAGISTAEYPVLLRLYSGDGITQEQLTQELLVDKSAVTRVVQSLLNKGLIERKRDEWDHRCYRIFLTEKADAHRKIIESAQFQWNNILQDQMDETERQIFQRLLKQAADNAKEWYQSCI